MNPDTLALLIPIIAVGGFFGWMIALAASKAYLAKLKAQSPPGVGAEHEELVAAVHALRQEVAELAERVDFTERLLKKPREGERLAPPR
jgi:hypothetical protein